MFRSNHRASVLISVLWIIAVLTILVLALGYEARGDVERTILYRDRAKAYWLARAAVERAKYDFALSKMRADEEFESRAVYNFEFEQGTAMAMIQSNASKMPMNTKNRELWKQFLKMWVPDDDERDALVDAIFDWTDPNDEVGLNGAEIDYYQELVPPYEPRNGNFFSVEEILLVRGVTEQMFYGSPALGLPGMRELLSLNSPNAGRFDINTAPKGILMAFLEIGPQEADEIIRLRNENLFENVQDAGSLINIEAIDNIQQYFMVYQGNQFTIKATGYAADSDARYTVEDEVRYTGGGRLYVNLSHKDFSMEHVDEFSAQEGDVQ